MAVKESPSVSLFKKKAEFVGAKVVEVKNLDEAMSYALDLCEQKEFCEILDVERAGEAEPAEDGVKRATKKTVAAPGLDEPVFAELQSRCDAKGFETVRKSMRERLSGVDLGFTTADMGVAETGSCVIVSQSEDLRLATMVCEIHVVALPKARVVESLTDAEEFLNEAMRGGVMYTSFISGPSRTADIERVLALGVHGPLELHVALMEEC